MIPLPEILSPFCVVLFAFQIQRRKNTLTHVILFFQCEHNSCISLSLTQFFFCFSFLSFPSLFLFISLSHHSLLSFSHPLPPSSCLSSTSGVVCSWTPRRPSSCWSTSTAWCLCQRPSQRSTSRSATRTASSTWSMLRRRPSAAREERRGGVTVREDRKLLAAEERRTESRGQKGKRGRTDWERA